MIYFKLCFVVMSAGVIGTIGGVVWDSTISEVNEWFIDGAFFLSAIGALASLLGIMAGTIWSIVH